MMKLLFLFFLFISSAFAQVQAFKCVDGNEESICDQEIRFYLNQNQLTAISVEYVGWCGSMGPYKYYCVNNICEDPGIKFEFKDLENYVWTNKQYGFFCTFKKK